MPNFNYVALDSRGNETAGVMEVASQSEVLMRLKAIGVFPTKVAIAPNKPKGTRRSERGRSGRAGAKRSAFQTTISIPGLSGRVNAKTLSTFTRQLATLVDAGMPLLRGLRLLEAQQRHTTLKRTIAELGHTIEGGGTFTEALAQHPKVFNRLFVNMVKAGEIGGVLEVVLARLAEFMEKAQKIKGKIRAAMFYPCAVIVVAVAILAVLMIWVVPRFKEIFKDMARPLPDFTKFVFALSASIANHLLATSIVLLLGVVGLVWFARTRFGRRIVDHLKLSLPVLGHVIRQMAISRFTRTLGTLVNSGVPILQALTMVKETSGNVIVASAVGRVHDSVKEGETITAPLAASGVFPPMVVGMVDVGEQTGALPEMLMKIAETYDEEVDNAVASLTSLLEPIMIVFLAIVVGSIVIALFLPLISLMDGFGDPASDRNGSDAE
jgi:type IV pilus assembly protein PilC